MAERAGTRRTHRHGNVVRAALALVLAAGALLTGAATPAAAAGTPGTISTVYPGGSYIAVADDGGLYISRGTGFTYRAPDGTVTTTSLATPYCSNTFYDLRAKYCNIRPLAVGPDGTLYFAEYGTLGGITPRVWRYAEPDPVLIAGGGPGSVSAGDGGPAVGATIIDPRGLAVGPDNTVYVTDGARLRAIDPDTGVIDTVAGNGTPGYSGDGGPAADAQVGTLYDVDVDSSGNVFLADNARVRTIDQLGTISTIAGDGGDVPLDDGGPATEASVHPIGIAVDSAGNVYFPENPTKRLRMINTSGVITTIAGTGERESTGDGGPASEATLYDPRHVGVDAAGNVFVAGPRDTRRVEALATSTSGSVVGRVTETDGSTGVAGVVVSVLAPWPSWSVVGTATTGATGTYTVPGLAPGSYRVRYWDPTGAHPRTWFSDARTYHGATDVVVAAGSVGIAHQTLTAESAVVTGRVTETGSGVGLGAVAVMVVGDTGWVAGAITGTNGYYHVGGIQPGDYKVFFFDLTLGHSPRWYPDAAHVSGAVPVSLPAGATMIDAALPTL